MHCFLCFNPTFHLHPWWSEGPRVNRTHPWCPWLTCSQFSAGGRSMSLSLLSLRCVAGGSRSLHVARPEAQSSPPRCVSTRGQCKWPYVASINALYLNYAPATDQSWEQTMGLPGPLVWPNLFCSNITKTSKEEYENMKWDFSILCCLKCNNFPSWR